MDNYSSTQPFHNHHHHLPSFHPALPNLQSPEVGYLPSQHTLDPLVQYGSTCRDEEPKTSFTTSVTSSGGKRGSSGDERSLLNASGGTLDGHANLRGHFDDESVRGGHFENDDFYPLNCGAEENISNYSGYGSCGAKFETIYNREDSVSRFIKQTTSYNKSATRSLNDGCASYCRTDSMLNNDYLEKDGDYGSSCGSGEDPQQPAEDEGPWLSVSPSDQTGGGRWRGAADAITSHCPPQRSAVNMSSGIHIQKLDSFSEAFLSQRKRSFPVILSGDSSQQIWDSGERQGERHSCAFDSDSYPPPSSSSPPAHLSLPSFPSPPTSSHLMSSVLSPPPTPLPPPSLSPLKMDSPVTFGGPGHSLSQMGEPLGPLQIFASRIQSLPSVHSSGMIWKFSLPSRCFKQSYGDLNNMEGTLRSSHGRDYSNVTGSNNILQSPDSSVPSSSSGRSPLHPVRTLCPTNAASPLSSPHAASHSSHITRQYYEGTEMLNLHMTDQKVKNGPTGLRQSQQQASQTYTGTPFSSILHPSRGQKRGPYTPRPQLNPVRTGRGLYACISSLHHREEKTAWTEGDNDCGVLPHINIGQDFQAELPPCLDGRESEVWSPEEESSREQLLWKPWGRLEESPDLQNQVERLLSVCSSSCLPGGGNNTELALHCLHHCQGDVKATLEMLLFSRLIPTEDYHYSGSDLWTEGEKNIFSAALETHGKDFSCIHKLVKTKTVFQCVEFYYLSKKLLDKQRKQKEEEMRHEAEQQKSITPICQPVDRQFGLEEAVPVPSLASFFPCKLCGKMFYKIKSRNAHMKIHRQPQEDWSDRQLQQQILTQHLVLGRPNNLMHTLGSDLLQSQAPALAFDPSGLPGASNNSNKADNVPNSSLDSHTISLSNASMLNPRTLVTYSNIPAPNAHVITNTDDSDSNQRQPASVLPFQQSWGSYGHSTNSATFYNSTEGKESVEAGKVEGKQPINWQ